MLLMRHERPRNAATGIFEGSGRPRWRPLSEAGTLVSLKLETQGSESTGAPRPLSETNERSDSGRSSEGNGNDESFRLTGDEGETWREALRRPVTCLDSVGCGAWI
jgi:hypothetical protein